MTLLNTASHPQVRLRSATNPQSLPHHRLSITPSQSASRHVLHTTVPHAERSDMQLQVSEAFAAFIGLDWADANTIEFIRLNHWLPRAQAHPEVMQGTADLHHHIATPSFQRRMRSFTMRQRFTLLLTCSIRSRRWCRPGWRGAAPASAPGRGVSWSA